LCDAAIRELPSERGLLINYRQIPGVVWGDLCTHFGMVLDAVARERMQASAIMDAKNRGRRFSPDSVRRQSEASDAIRRAAERWAVPQYEILERMRGQGRC
jgi:hypothetical protein